MSQLLAETIPKPFLIKSCLNAWRSGLCFRGFLHWFSRSPKIEQYNRTVFGSLPILTEFMLFGSQLFKNVSCQFTERARFCIYRHKRHVLWFHTQNHIIFSCARMHSRNLLRQMNWHALSTAHIQITARPTCIFEDGRLQIKNSSSFGQRSRVPTCKAVQAVHAYFATLLPNHLL